MCHSSYDLLLLLCSNTVLLAVLLAVHRDDPNRCFFTCAYATLCPVWRAGSDDDYDSTACWPIGWA